MDKFNWAVAGNQSGKTNLGFELFLNELEKYMATYLETINSFYPTDRSDRAARAEGSEEVIEAALGLAGEAGETVDIIKKYVYYGKVINGDALLLELGDTLHYLTRLAGMFGWTLEDLMTANIEKLEKRFGKGYSDTAAIAQAEKGE